MKTFFNAIEYLYCKFYFWEVGPPGAGATPVTAMAAINTVVWLLMIIITDIYILPLDKLEYELSRFSVYGIDFFGVFYFFPIISTVLVVGGYALCNRRELHNRRCYEKWGEANPIWAILYIALSYISVLLMGLLSFINNPPLTSEETFAHAKESTELSYIEVFDRDIRFQGIINGLFRVMHKSEDIASILTYADTKFTFKTYSCLGKKDMQIRYDTSEASKKELQEKLNLVIDYETFFNILKTVRTYINSEAYEKVYPFKYFPIVTLPASSLEHEKINISYSGNLVSLTTPHPLDNYSNIDIDFHFDKNLDTWKISNFICQVHDGISFTPENTIIDWAEKRKRVKQLENKRKKIILFLENQTIKNKFKTSNSSFSEKELDVLGRNNTETETKKILTLLKNEKMEIRASEAFIHVDNAKNKTNSLIGFIYDNQTEEWKLYTIE